MDLAYLAVTVFGMCAAAQPCRSTPTTAGTAAAVTLPPPLTDVDGERSGRSVPPLHQSVPWTSAGRRHYDDVRYDDAVTADDAFYVRRQQWDDADDDRSNDVDEQQAAPPPSGRARPGKPAADSPVYFIRLPPQPYVYVPGYGYVSQPTRLEPPPFAQRPHSPFMNLPLGYVSNGKPVGVYTLPQQHQQHQYQQQHHHQQQQQQQQPQYQLPAGRPKPNRRPQPPQQTTADSPVYNLDKGPYAFNGRPSDAYLLQTAYDNLYSEVLQNIYP